MKPRLTSDWDRIVTSAPLNKDAAVARDNRGGAWVPGKPIGRDQLRSHAPLPMRRYTDVPENDITGKRFGSFVALGLGERKGSNSKGSSWVVRCDCSYYEHRTAKALRSLAASGRAMCQECDYLAQIKAGTCPTPKEREAIREQRRALKIAQNKD